MEFFEKSEFYYFVNSSKRNIYDYSSYYSIIRVVLMRLDELNWYFIEDE